MIIEFHQPTEKLTNFEHFLHNNLVTKERISLLVYPEDSNHVT